MKALCLWASPQFGLGQRNGSWWCGHHFTALSSPLSNQLSFCLAKRIISQIGLVARIGTERGHFATLTLKSKPNHNHISHCENNTYKHKGAQNHSSYWRCFRQNDSNTTRLTFKCSNTVASDSYYCCMSTNYTASMCQEINKLIFITRHAFKLLTCNVNEITWRLCNGMGMAM